MARQRPNQPRKRGSKRSSGGRSQRGKRPAATYYMQPGKRGSVVVLHRPVGNRASPKVCAVMPTRAHAKALVDQLQRAETALHDLFYEATDDGILALEAVLTAHCDAVLKRMPPSGDTISSPEEMAAERDRIQRELDARASQQRAAS